MSDATQSGLQPGTSALHRLCTATPDEFAREVWARRAWLSRAADLPGDVADVFSRSAADELLSSHGLRTPFLRMAKDGKVIPTSRFTGPGGAGAMVADQIHDEAVLGLFSDGATVVLQGLHRTWQPVSVLAAGLAADLGHPVQVNSYITPPQSQGFAPHYDTHDVFVLQIDGRKHWRIHEPVLAQPLPDEPWDTVADQVAQRAAEPPVLDVTLQPGDCLYLPRGFLHAATALGETSIHLTFGIHTTAERDVVRALADGLVQASWRASMPVGWEPSEDSLTALRDRAVAALAALDLTAVARQLRADRARKQRPEPLSPLAQAQIAADLSQDTSIRLRRGIAARLANSAVVFSTGSITISEDEREAVSLLLKGQEVRVGELPLAEPAALDLAARLLRSGAVVPGAEA